MKCRMFMSNCMPSITPPSGRYALAVLQLSGTKCSRRADSQNAKEYPGLSVNLVTGIPAPDLIADGLDVVSHRQHVQDSSLFSRRLGAMPMVVCAAKSYLTQYGIPEKPADLSSHSWLEYSVRPDNEFELIAPEGISTGLIPQGRFVTNDPMTLVRWLTAGAGIAYVPLMWVINEINRRGA
ncbi:LysR substrate-binding domain-containing protein [Escherichia coli]